MLNKYYKMFDSIEILDTSNNTILPICNMEGRESFTSLSDEDIPDWFKNGLPEIYKILAPQ